MAAVTPQQWAHGKGGPRLNSHAVSLRRGWTTILKACTSVTHFLQLSSPYEISEFLKTDHHLDHMLKHMNLEQILPIQNQNKPYLEIYLTENKGAPFLENAICKRWFQTRDNIRWRK